MSKDLFKTFAESTLAASITTATTSFSVAAGEGGKFPAITGTDFFICVLLNKSNGDVEVVKVTARSVDTFTVVRDYEGTGPKAFNSGDIIRLSCVASTLNNFLQASAQTNTIKWDDDNSGSGPTLDLHRNSQTPADGDLLGNILFSGEDDLSNKVTYGEILGIAKDVTNATTDGRILIRTMNNNVLTDQINVSNSFIDFYNDLWLNQASEPYLYFYRNDSTPNDGDDIGTLFFRGEDSASNATNYARITGNIISTTDGSEDGEIQLHAKVNAVTTKQMSVGNGVVLGSPTGGYLGQGYLNVSGGLSINNNPVPDTGSSNTFTADQTIQSNDAGAGSGPALSLFRNSASPAANDYIGSIPLKGKNDAGTTVTYAEIVGQITDVANGSEDAKLILRTMVNGTLTDALILPGSSGGGGLTLISTQTASSSSSLDFTNVFDATYDEYIVEFQRLVPSAGGSNLRAQISNDGGSTWLNTLYTWGVREVTAGGALGTSNSSSDSSYRFNSTNVEGNGYAGLNGRMNIFDPVGKGFSWTADIIHTDGANVYTIRNFCGGFRKDSSTTGYDSIKFYFDGTSNIVSGKIRIYGVTK